MIVNDAPLEWSGCYVPISCPTTYYLKRAQFSELKIGSRMPET